MKRNRQGHHGEIPRSWSLLFNLDTILCLPVLTAFIETADSLRQAANLQIWPRKLISLVEELRGGCASAGQPPADDLCLQIRATTPEQRITPGTHYEGQMAFLR